MTRRSVTGPRVDWCNPSILEMNGLLVDYRRKRARADAHFQAIEQVIEQFTEREPDLVPGRFDTDRRQYVFEWPRPLPDPGLALIVGDCVYNLRASLDYLMTALVRATGNEESHTTAFPIYDVPITTVPFTAVRDGWEADPNRTLARMLKGTPPETKAFLQQLQPFDGAPGMDPDDHPLAMLKGLSNRDKHRRLNLVASRISITFTDVGGKPIFDTPTPHGSVSIPEGTESDTQIVLLRLGPESSESETEVYLGALYDVAFEEDRPFLRASVIDTLTIIREFIDRRVVPTITLLLGSWSSR